MPFSYKKFLLGLAVVGVICMLVFASLFSTNNVHFPTLGKTVWENNLTSGDFVNEWQVGKKHRFGFENLSIIDDPSQRFKKVFRVLYPKGSTSPSYARSSGNPVGGVQFLADLYIKPVDSIHLRYSVRFADNFNFVRGGKLPGLYGGDVISGGNIPNDTNGFSTRFMWKEKGMGEVDAYLPIDIHYGTDEGLGSFQFIPGKWYTLEQELNLNTPKKDDGRIRVWVNGTQVMDIKNLRFRSVNSLKIQGIFFSTFFGGHDSSWATPVTTYADFANFKVSTKYIGI